VSSKAVLKELKKRVKAAEDAALVPKFSLKDHLFDKQLEFVQDVSKFKTAVCSRRCLAEGTLVQTTLGPKKIEEITTNDWVFDEFGAPIKVLQVLKNGTKEVVELKHNTKTLVECTRDHVFLTQDTYSSKVSELKVSEFLSRTKILRNEVDRNNGALVKYAYALGALLGDGCSRTNFKSYITISSEDEKIPNKVGELLGATLVKKAHINNYSYNIYLPSVPEEYTQWCNTRYAHEKTCDIKRILSWDRGSRLAFIAGLIDTDGSVSILKDGIQIDISMQAKPVIEAAQLLFLDLWNVRPSIGVDNREKYKNGPVYCLRIKNNYFSKKILKDLDPFIVTDRKKWKNEYAEKLENNYRPDRVGVTLGKSRVSETYDIFVDSDTNLYMLANGLITHNSGKTESCAADLIFTCLESPNVNCAYITLTRVSAKRIIWSIIKRVINDYRIPILRYNNSDLSVEFKNGSVLYISGAKDASEIERFRGMSLKKIYIDECQSFRSYIKALIDDILVPSTWDVNGSICLIGTPGPVPAGFFYDCTHSPEWSNHKWNILDNPWILKKSGRTPEQLLLEERTRKGISESDPSYQREALGLWAKDDNALVFKFQKTLNIVQELPSNLTFVFGIDLGFNDADAIAVLGFDYKHDCVYLVEEFIQAKQTISDLVTIIKRLDEKYSPVKMVIDAGALGKKIAEEIKQRHAIPVEAAEKTRKLEFIELFNDDLRTGKFKALSGTRFEEDCYLVQWNMDDPTKRVVSDTYHSDILDSALYAWKECKHYIPKSNITKPAPNTDAYMDQLEAKEAEEMELRQQGHDLDWGVDQGDLDAVFDVGSGFGWSNDDEF
jgi:DNA-binding transcriptional regulator WhiA